MGLVRRQIVVSEFNVPGGSGVQGFGSGDFRGSGVQGSWFRV